MHSIPSHRRTFRRASAAALVATCAASPAHAAGSASETALVVTGVLTIVVVAISLLAIVLPEEEQRAFGSALARLRNAFLRGKSRDIPLAGHNFDGIEELDNRIPPWFTTLFAITVVFAAIYLLDYHLLGSSPLSGEEYRQEMSAAELHRRIVMATEGQIDEAQLVRLTDPAAIGRGAENFAKYCVSCHGPQAGGMVGPNLTDDYWIHGGTVRNVYTTIKQGVPAKGMISWQLVFAPKQIQELASYVLSLRGTNPAGAKKPEGILVVETAATPDSVQDAKR
jgi:cytochrome c oxidase cbb3-type subunit 3